MLIVLKQGNKEIAELLAIAPRSVLMLRHRFRQKIGMTTDNSLENFIEDTLKFTDSSNETPVADWIEGQLESTDLNVFRTSRCTTDKPR
jgi:hypothetical protein